MISVTCCNVSIFLIKINIHNVGRKYNCHVVGAMVHSKTFQPDIYNCRLLYVQLGQASVNPQDLCLKWGDFNFAGGCAWKAKVPPPPSSSKSGGFTLA